MLEYIVDECVKWNGLFDSAEVEIGAAEFAVVFAGGQVFFCREAHALAVLPDVACLALDHELPRLVPVLACPPSSAPFTEKHTTYNIPLLPQMQRVTPCSSSCSSGSPRSTAPSSAGSSTTTSASLSLPLRFALRALRGSMTSSPSGPSSC